MNQEAEELLHGACDLHIHGGPDVVPRRQDMAEVAEEARLSGMSAVVFKDHNTNTADRARLVSKFVPDVRVFGGIVLNHAVGGFNPHAVEMAVAMGAKVVWMPSVDARPTVQRVAVDGQTEWLRGAVWLQEPRDGLSIYADESKNDILPEIKEILALLRGTDVILDTCHLEAKEAYVIILEAKRLGLDKIVVTHPNCSVNRMTIEEQRELADTGALMAYAFLPCMPMYDGQRPTEIAEMITAVGPDRSILISDFGQMQNPTVVEGMRMFISHMLAAGISPESVSLMVRDNPQRLLSIDKG